MSGRGRGRGRGKGAVPPSVAASSAYNYANASNSSFCSASGATGIPGSRSEPTLKFPEMILPNLPQSEDFSADFVAASEYSERIQSMIQQTPSFRPLKSTQTKIDRYSDKYLSKSAQSDQKRERLSNIVTDLSFFPEELHSVYGSAASSKASTAAVKKSVSIKETLTHLDEIAMKEEEGKGAGEKAEGGEEEDEDADEAVYEEDEFEDETDYNASYFDNGEDYGDYDDGNDEAVF